MIVAIDILESEMGRWDADKISIKKMKNNLIFFEENPQIVEKFVIFNIKVNELDNWKISPIFKPVLVETL